MEKIYVTITGMNHRFGSGFVEAHMLGKMKITLEKEPENEYDNEAIMAKLPPLGKIGYVANNSFSVVGDCYSAGRLYDKIGDTATATVEYKVGNGLICSVDEEGLIYPVVKDVIF